MNHLLYHSGDRVLFVAPHYGIYKPTPAYVIKTIEAGEPYHCPHCNKRLSLNRQSVHKYAYYLDWWYSGECCKPFSYNQLRRVHSPCTHPFKFVNGAITLVE